jgi:hypothetical protein
MEPTIDAISAAMPRLDFVSLTSFQCLSPDFSYVKEVVGMNWV